MLNFPDSPAVDQVFASGAVAWRWDGGKWVAKDQTSLSGMVAGQIPIAAAATAIASSANLSGDVSSNAALATTLATVNSNVGTFQGLTVNAKGLVTAATNQSYLTANQTITLSGDVSGSGTTAITTTLATVPVAKGGTNKTSWVAGSVAFAASATALAEDNANLFFDNTNKRLGIGTAAPGSKLTVSANAAALPVPSVASEVLRVAAADGTNTRIILDAFGGATAGLNVRATGGPASAPTATPNGQGLGGVFFSGYSPAGYAGGVRIWGYASELWSDTAHGSVFAVDTTLNGTVAPAERMRIDHNGNVGIGTTAPGAKLHVGARATSGGVEGTAAVILAAPDDGYASVVIQRAGVVNPQVLDFGVNQASLYSEIQSAQNGINVGPLYLNRQGGNVVLNATAGNVGIGTTGPRAKLEISGGAFTNMAMTDTSAALDTKTFDFALTGGALIGRCVSDNYGSQTTWLQVARSGATATSVTFPTGVGVVVGAPTGGNLGTGKINAVEVRANNVVLTSDENLKTDIEPLPPALPLLAAIEPKTFRWKPLEDEESQPPDFTEQFNRGFLAQDVAKALGGDGSTVDLGGLVAILWQAVRELRAEVAALSADR
jgi:hypothetical protein